MFLCDGNKEDQGNDDKWMHEMTLKEPSEDFPNRVSSVSEKNENIHSESDSPKPISASPTTPSGASN